MEDRTKQNATPKSKGKVLSAAELTVFCSQIALILKSGVPLYEGVSIMHEDIADGKGKEVLGIIDERVSNNSSFYQALLAAEIFPDYMVNMVRIGEASGRLDEVMESMAEYYEREKVLKERIKSAVLYPIILIAMMSAVIMVLIIKVLPIFDQVFKQLGTEMGATPTAIMNFGMVAGRYSLIVLGVLVLLIIVLFAFAQTRSGSVFFGKFLSGFVLTRGLAAKLATGRFAAAMSLMIASGLNTDEALKLTPPVVNNPGVNRKIAQCMESIEKGESFPDAIYNAKIFSGVFSKMVKVGFKAGFIDSVMRKLADVYEEEVDDRLGNIVSLLEPILVAILSIIIGVILISVMLPLMSIMSAIG